MSHELQTYRRKPTVVYATRFSHDNYNYILEILMRSGRVEKLKLTPVERPNEYTWNDTYEAKTSEVFFETFNSEEHCLRVGDWLVQNEDGSFEVYTNELFKHSFNLIEDKTLVDGDNGGLVSQVEIELEETITP